MGKYQLTEGAPSASSYMRCGRGGAGNIYRATGSATKSYTVQPSAASSTRFFSGIGGAGNAHSASERPSATASLDDAVRHAAARDTASVGYCGRGGAGNIYRRKESDASSSSAASTTSSGSAGSVSKLWTRVSGSFGRE